MSRQLQGLGVNNINVRRRDSKDNAVWLRDILGDKVSCLLLDIAGLVANRYLCTCQLLISQRASHCSYLGETREINKSQAQHMWRVYLQVDGLSVDTLVVPGNPRRLVLDFAFHILEVCKLAPWDVMEFSPFALRLDAGGCMGYMYFASFRCVIVAWDVDKLQNEGSPSNYATASGKKVPSDNILQHG